MVGTKAIVRPVSTLGIRPILHDFQVLNDFHSRKQKKPPDFSQRLFSAFSGSLSPIRLDPSRQIKLLNSII